MKRNTLANPLIAEIQQSLRGTFHPAGLIFSTLGAILVLFLCYKLRIRFPHI